MPTNVTPDHSRAKLGGRKARLGSAEDESGLARPQLSAGGVLGGVSPRAVARSKVQQAVSPARGGNFSGGPGLKQR